jgi:membrane-associated phospholipid phosphatase
MLIALLTSLLALSAAGYEPPLGCTTSQTDDSAAFNVADATCRDASGDDEASGLVQDAAPQQSEPKSAPASGQGDSEAKKPPTPPHTGIRALMSGLLDDVKHLPTTDNLYLALLGGGLAAAAHPFDQTFNVHLRSHYTLVNGMFWPAKYYGDTPEQVAISLGTYAYGRIFDEPKVSHLGMDLLRAQIITEVLIQPIKFATHRQRPDKSNYQSFPSGHAAVTFAGATVLERHLGWKKAALAYVVATYVAMSRLHDNVHYLSDVAFGAAVGTIAGRTVTQHGAISWTLVPVNVPGGIAVVASRTH